ATLGKPQTAGRILAPAAVKGWREKQLSIAKEWLAENSASGSRQCCGIHTLCLGTGLIGCHDNSNANKRWLKSGNAGPKASPDGQIFRGGFASSARGATAKALGKKNPSAAHIE
uniref:SCP domain-containing protein n=1 Tax=Macrostomum lignano TaxID=282301 RepID=A0A1I8F747_9PLAT